MFILEPKHFSRGSPCLFTNVYVPRLNAVLSSVLPWPAPVPCSLGARATTIGWATAPTTTWGDLRRWPPSRGKGSSQSPPDHSIASLAQRKHHLPGNTPTARANVDWLTAVGESDTASACHMGGPIYVNPCEHIFATQKDDAINHVMFLFLGSNSNLWV